MNPNNTPKQQELLNRFGRSVTSQGGEDGIIEKILETIGINDGWCVEFGSWDGKHLSNTWNLVANKGYSAVLIEGAPKRCRILKKNFESNPKVIPVNAFVGFNHEDSLDRILEKTAIPRDFDVLSIDIDGNDYHVWDAIKNYTPKLVVIEFNPTVPPSVEFVQPRDMRITQGSSLLSMVQLGRSKGYELIAAESANAFFIKKEYRCKFDIHDNSVEAIWTDQSAVTQMFFGYDGTVFLQGLTVHPWTQIPIRESKMQILPAWARKRAVGRCYIMKKAAKIYRRFKKVKSSR
jgi:hypothetical protein